MKKLLFLAVAMTAFFAQGAPELNDTIITKPQKVTIAKEGNGSMVTVVTNNGDKLEYYYNDQPEVKNNELEVRVPLDTDADSENSKWSLIMSGIYFGTGWNQVDKDNAYVHDEIGHEYEIGLLNAMAVSYRPAKQTEFSLGFGLNWRQINMHHGQFFKDENNVVDAAPFEQSYRHRNSSLQLFSLQFPLIYRQTFYKKNSFFLGPIMNVNTGAHISTSFKDGDTKVSYETGKLHQRKVSFDAILGINFDDIGIYTRWRPQSVFEENYGPKISSWSVGLILLF